MDFRDLYYFREAARDLHFTKTAERLFISQQNLSNHIKKLEEQYKVVLFVRKPKVDLTYAGRRMLAYADDLLAREGDLQEEMKEIHGETSGELVVGASTPRLRVLLPEVLPQFLREYPGIRIRTVDAYAVELQQYVIDNQVDIAFAPIQPDQPEMIVETMHRDNIFVVCSDRLLYREYGLEAFDIKASCARGCTMDQLARLPFIVPSSRNQLSTEFYSCFEEQNMKPNILMETAFPLYYFPLFSDGTAAGFLTLSSLSEGLSSMRQPVNYFQVYRNGTPLGHTIYSFQNKRRYEPAYLRRFKELAKECFEGIEKMRLSYVEGQS
ncbi:MAG: LysR family transcriptional regulator [Lachnospiraceae bacterium]|nr:LysR family transcriptional regulator [Lachnospiraceae bacterium]